MSLLLGFVWVGQVSVQRNLDLWNLNLKRFGFGFPNVSQQFSFFTNIAFGIRQTVPLQGKVALGVEAGQLRPHWYNRHEILRQNSG